MIENATVYFSNGKTASADRVKFCDAGMVGVRASDGWIYYPRESIGRVVCRDRAENHQDSEGSVDE